MLLTTYSDSPNLFTPLGVQSNCFVEEKLPIVPNYLQNPVFPFSGQLPDDTVLSHNASSTSQAPPLDNHKCNDRQHPTAVYTSATDVTVCHVVAQPTCLVVKVRLADSAEKDFVEVEVPKSSYQGLLQACCSELEVRPEAVSKIRKLPNVVVRKDKDTERLMHGQELEMVMRMHDDAII